MQTILGANGQIGEELARELKRNYTSDIRIVSRNPHKVNDTDELFAADLSHLDQAIQATKGSEIAYFTLGLPMNTPLWEQQFVNITKNVIQACKINNTKLVFFDNTYMYAQNNEVLTEQTLFAPTGRKGQVRKEMAELILNEINKAELKAVICRAPEFYGPDKTQSITNSLIFDKIKKNKIAKVPLSDKTKRSLIWTPDASRATALIGNTPKAYGQTWHLPVDQQKLTYKELIQLISQVYGQTFKHKVITNCMFKLGSIFNDKAKELQELLPRYAYDNLFNDSKFRKHFPDFKITSYEEGISIIKNQQKNQKLN